MSDMSFRARVRLALNRLTGADPAVAKAHLRELQAIRTLVGQTLQRLERLDKAGKERDAAVAEVRAQLKGIRMRLDAAAADEKVARKHRQHLVRQVTGLVRSQYLQGQVPATEALLARRFRLYSQNEEDGIVLALLEAAGVGARRFVDIGSGSSGGNCCVLALEMGWAGLMVESRPESADRLRRKLAHNPRVAVAAAFVTADNVNELIRSHDLSGEIDVLSIDIDSTDYWVFEALEACTARVVVIEYNALFGPDRAVTIPNAPRPGGASGEYVGASLAALDQLARRKGYGLVLCEDTGINAFFLRDGLAAAIPRLSAATAYRPRRMVGTAEPREPEDVLREIERSGWPLVEV